jgi:hypothetical protein
VLRLTSTTFTSTMIVCVSTTCWTFVTIIDEIIFASQQTLDNLSFYVHSNHRCDMHMKMSFMFFDLVVSPLWLPLWSTLSSFCISPPCDLSSHNLCNVYQIFLYYFVLLLVLPI